MELVRKAIALILCFFTACPAPLPDAQLFGSTGTSSIRQEVNITNAYYYAASGSYATSSEIVAITPNNYSAPYFYFEVVASTTAATNATISLVNATSSATVASVTVNGTSYSRYRSTGFLPNASTTVEYKVKLGDESVGKGLIAARVIVLQDTSSLTATETQIEVGSATTSAANTTSLPLQYPKYWTYSSSKWDASPTFYAEVTYDNNPVASSTSYDVSATTTDRFATYVGSPGVGFVTVEAWGPGGGGDGVTSAATLGGGGGGGGAYARSTTTVAVGSTRIIGVGRGGAEGTAATASSTFSNAGTIVVQAAGGTGATSATGAAGGTTANSTGDVEWAGGTGGNGDTTLDIGGGGGGAAGPEATSTGQGVNGNNATASVPGRGGNGNNGQGGLGGSGGTTNTDTCSTSDGRPGTNNDRGGGGGGGAGGDATGVCVGGNGGRPGGGGGGSDEGPNTSHLGGPGRVKITEWIGTVGVALEEDNGSFGGWTFKTQIVAAGKTSTTSERVRSAAFTPTDGRHYRIVASTTQSTASYDIYNAKIVISQDTITEVVSSFSKTFVDSGSGVSGTHANKGQSFQPNSSGTLSTAAYKFQNTGSAVGTIFMEIYAASGALGSNTPTGSALATSDNVDLSTLSTGSYATTTFSFTGSNKISLSSAEIYVLTLTINITGGSGVFIATESTGNSASLGNSSGWNGSNWTANTDDYDYSVITASSPTLLEPQYLLLNKLIGSGTGLQSYNTLFDTTDWATTNNYIHAVSAADNSTSVVVIQDTSGPTTITGSTVTSPDNYATSTGMCLESNATLDTKATTNNNDIYSSSIIVQVGTASTAICATTPATLMPQAEFFFE